MNSENLTERLENFVDSPVGCACFNVQKASRAISQFYEEAMQEVGLRSNQMSLLVGIGVAGKLGIGVLAEQLVTDRTTLTRNVRTLVDMGLVRECQGNDKRIRSLSLTSKGRRTLESALPLWEAAQARVQEHVGESGMRALRKLSDQVVGLVHPDHQTKRRELLGRTKT